jgi:signal transduction histidine kinase
MHIPSIDPQKAILGVSATTVFVLLIFFGLLLISRHSELAGGNARVNHLSGMLAAHTARSLEAVDLLLEHVSDDLAHTRNWNEWSPEHGYDYASKQHTGLPQLREIAIIDKQGRQRFLSDSFPATEQFPADQSFIQNLYKGAVRGAFGPFVSRNSGRYTFALVHRIDAPDRSFGGAVVAALEPGYFQEFCWPNRINDRFEAVLVNDRDIVIASCRPTDLSRQASVVGREVHSALADGILADAPLGQSELAWHGWRIVSRNVPGYDGLRIICLLPEHSMLVYWNQYFLPFALLACLCSLLVWLGGHYLKQQAGELTVLQGNLDRSREQLAVSVEQATRDLGKQKLEAERANAAKSRFLAAASHDLRQPLHALSLFVADLQRHIRLGDFSSLDTLAHQLQASTETMRELLDSLLDLSRLDVAGIAPQIQPFSVAELFQRLSTSFSRAAENKGLKFRIRASKYWVNSDPMLVERLLANLIANSIRYTKQGSILIAARKRSNSVQLEVRDSGIGISVEHQRAIFAEFYQIDNVAREFHKGLGLGLSIVDRLSRALGSEIGLRSRLQHGTTFSIKLPATRANDKGAKKSQAGSGKPIYLIGNTPLLHQVATLLADWGYPVQLSGESELNASQLPDAIYLADAASDLGAAYIQLLKPLIVFADATVDIPPHAIRFQRALRPAKLRALLRQLDVKT